MIILILHVLAVDWISIRAFPSQTISSKEKGLPAPTVSRRLWQSPWRTNLHPSRTFGRTSWTEGRSPNSCQRVASSTCRCYPRIDRALSKVYRYESSLVTNAPPGEAENIRSKKYSLRMSKVPWNQKGSKYSLWKWVTYKRRGMNKQ